MANDYLTGWRLILLNIAIGLGTFTQILDTSIANVAVPYIAGNLSVSPDQGTWVITSFAASNAVVLPLTGWLSDYFGRVRLYVVSVFLFAIVSLFCALSTSLSMLVFFRVIQGAVAGSLVPLSQSLLVANNPPEKQGTALGFWTTIVIVAPIVGPVLGGYLTYVYSWPWIFYINLPIGLFSSAVTWFFLSQRESKIVRNPIDWLGLFLLIIGVCCLQIMFDKGKDLDWFESNAIIALLIISLISLGYFFIWTIYQINPIVDLSFFKNRNFTLGTIAITLGFLIYFGSTVTIPLWLQTEQNYTAYWAGIAVAPIGIIPFIFSTTLGKNLYRFDLRYVSALSFIILSLSFFYQARFTTNIDVGTVMMTRFLQGFGLLLFFLPIFQLSLAGISSERYASASGLFHFIRILIGSGFGTSVSIYVWNRLEIFHYERLGEAINLTNPLVRDLYKLPFSKDTVTQIISQGVEKQAYMLSTNDLSWLGGWLLLLMIPFVLLCKKSTQAAVPTSEVGH